MKFHEILRQRRLALGLTQEQLAQRLGVSAPAVNKWERNNSYPDITLLPPLARLLEVDLNTLLSFQEELTEEEIGAFANVLGERAQQEGCEAAFRLARDKLREYPNSDLLPIRRPRYWTGHWCSGRGGRTTRNGSRRGRGDPGPLPPVRGQWRQAGAGAGGADAHLPVHGPGRAGAGRGTAGPPAPGGPGTAHAGGHAPQETEAVGRGVAHSGAGAVPAGIRSPVYPHGFDGPGAGGRGQGVRAQYSETAEQAGRVFQLTAYAVASAPLQLALAEQDGPEALAVLERLLRSLEEPWD